MKKILSLLLAAALPLSAACTMVARAEEKPAPSGLVPGLVEMTVFGNHVDKPKSVYPQANGQIFNEGYTPENAPVYCNPIVFNYNYSANAGETLGVVSDAPFSAAFIANIIESSPTERYTHLTNAVLFRGTATYLKENNSRSAADPHAIYYNNVWYVYASGGYQLRSEDFVNWEVVPAMNADGTQMTFTAPSVGYRTDESGKTTFYLAWNSSHIYSSERRPALGRTWVTLLTAACLSAIMRCTTRRTTPTARRTRRMQRMMLNRSSLPRTMTWTCSLTMIRTACISAGAWARRS